MKLLKAILFFVTIIGGVYLVSLLRRIIVPDSPAAPTAMIEVDEKCNEIRNAWGKEQDWNEQLLRSQKSDLDQDNSLGRYEFADDAETVRNTIREAATDKLCEAIFREFHSENCDDKLVRQNFAGVKSLSTTFGMARDERLLKVCSVKSLYDKISAFVNSKHIIMANYKADENSWTSFAAKSRSVINTATGYRNNPLYKKELGNITRFANGLKDDHIRQMVNSQENTYYDDLCNQIIAHFDRLGNDNEQVTEENRRRFSEALDRYSRETSLRVKDMTVAYREFKRKHEDKMKEE